MRKIYQSVLLGVFILMVCALEASESESTTEEILLPELDQLVQSRGCRILKDEHFHVSPQVDLLYTRGFLRNNPIKKSWVSYSCGGEKYALILFKFADKNISRIQLGFAKVSVLGGSMTGSAHHPERIYRGNEYVIILSTRQRAGLFDNLIFEYLEKFSPDHLFDVIENAIQCDNMDNASTSLCQSWEAFYTGEKLSELPNNYYTLGKALTYMPGRSPTEKFYALFVSRDKDKLNLDVVDIRPDDDNESRDMNKYVASIRSKKRDGKIEIHQWLDSQMRKGKVFPVQIERGTEMIAFTDQGKPVKTFVRQNGNTIYALEVLRAPNVPLGAIYTIANIPLD